MTESTTGRAPATVGRYRVLHKLGEGGMGIVYAARDELLDRRVAIKTLKTGLDDARTSERFLQEARAAASVNHPNICQLYEIGEHDRQPFLAMELLEGEPLAARVARGPLPAGETVQVALAMLSALGALHQRGLVHRDLKPSNVFLTPHGVKLLDFGLARRVDLPPDATQAGLTLPGTLLGTPHYMAPEQILGDPVDARADLFASGVILYEMLTGKCPFAGDTPMKVLDAVLHEQPPALVGSSAVAALDTAIHRALAKSPADRFGSAAAMADALRAALLAGDSGETPPPQAVTRVAVLPFRMLRPDAEVEFLAFALADAVSTSLSGLESVVVRSSLVGARYATELLDLKKISAELEVDVVLTGTLLRAGDALRVSTQLIDAANGQVRWSQTAQAALGDLFQLQDDLARRIVESLPVSSRDQQVRVRPDVPASPRAYELYLRASQLNQEAGAWPLARDLYEQCVAEDPNFAPAWARLGRLRRVLGKYGAEELSRALPEAEAAFRRALELNPDLSLAHNLYAQLEVDMGRAEDALRRLLGRAQVRQADPELFAGLVHACRYCGLLEASSAAHERARRLDPSVRTSVFHTYMMMGAYERAVEEQYVAGDVVGGLALAAMGRWEEALATLHAEKARMGHHQRMRAFAAGFVAVLEGDRERALAAFEPLTRGEWFQDGEGYFYVSRTLAYLGETDRALTTLAQAVENGFFCFPALARDPWLDPLRGRSEFAATLRRAEVRHRAAADLFLDAGGRRLLGVASGGGL